MFRFILQAPSFKRLTISSKLNDIICIGVDFHVLQNGKCNIVVR